MYTEFIIPKGGLCNRLMKIFGEYVLRKRFSGVKLYYTLIPDRECNGNLFDYIEPINFDNVIYVEPEIHDQFIKDNSLPVKVGSSGHVYNWQIRQLVGDEIFSERIRTFRSMIVAKPPTRDKIDSITRGKDFSNIIGCHVRLTDFITKGFYKNIGCNTEEDAINMYIKNFKEQLGDYSGQIYLACDCEIGRNAMLREFGDRIICYGEYYEYNEIDEIWGKINYKQRNMSLEYAVMDLILLSRCCRIYGSTMSSFSRFAADLGEKPFINIMGKE